MEKDYQVEIPFKDLKGNDMKVIAGWCYDKRLNRYELLVPDPHFWVLAEIKKTKDNTWKWSTEEDGYLEGQKDRMEGETTDFELAIEVVTLILKSRFPLDLHLWIETDERCEEYDNKHPEELA